MSVTNVIQRSGSESHTKSPSKLIHRKKSLAYGTQNSSKGCHIEFLISLSVNGWLTHIGHLLINFCHAFA